MLFATGSSHEPCFVKLNLLCEMADEGEISAWMFKVLSKLEHRPTYLLWHEAGEVRRYLEHSVDAGARRTLFHYLNEFTDEAFQGFALAFYCKYFEEETERWLCHNPSACVVALLRKHDWGEYQ